jgi:hypothetical protein
LAPCRMGWMAPDTIMTKLKAPRGRGRSARASENCCTGNSPVTVDFDASQKSRRKMTVLSSLAALQVVSQADC